MPIDVAQIAAKLGGRFVVFDGPDGAGKSTQHARLAGALRESGAKVTTCRDPGGTEVGDRVRSVLLDHDLSIMDLRCETLLFMASRAQLVSEVIRPALSRGEIVLCDRFVTSTLAYQGAAGDDAAKIVELANYATGGLWPDLTLLFDLPASEGLDRVKEKRGGGNTSAMDAMERRPADFHERVCENFRTASASLPGRFETVPATGSIDEVHQRVMECLSRVTL